MGAGEQAARVMIHAMQHIFGFCPHIYIAAQNHLTSNQITFIIGYLSQDLFASTTTTMPPRSPPPSPSCPNKRQQRISSSSFPLTPPPVDSYSFIYYSFACFPPSSGFPDRILERYNQHFNATFKAIYLPKFDAIRNFHARVIEALWYGYMALQIHYDDTDRWLVNTLLSRGFFLIFRPNGGRNCVKPSWWRRKRDQ